jgi:hypothetical protein
MKVFVINTPEKVYATYNETICFEGAFTLENQTIARAYAFAYGKYAPSCKLDEIETFEKWGPAEVFAFLEKEHK